MIYMDAAGLSAMVGKADQSHSWRTSVRSFELKLDMFGGYFYLDQGNSEGAT